VKRIAVCYKVDTDRETKIAVAFAESRGYFIESDDIEEFQ